MPELEASDSMEPTGLSLGRVSLAPGRVRDASMVTVTVAVAVTHGRFFSVRGEHRELNQAGRIAGKGRKKRKRFFLKQAEPNPRATG